MKKLNLIQKARYCGYILLVAVLFSACNNPVHTVCEGRQNLIVYKIEKCDDVKYGTFRYSVTDASGKGWTLYSFNQFAIGDTLRISNGN